MRRASPASSSNASSPRRLLVWGDSICAPHRSFSRVINQILLGLPDWQIVQVALNHPPHAVHPNHGVMGVDPADGPLGFDLLETLAYSGKFDALLIVQDLHVVDPFEHRIAGIKASGLPVVFYFPVDGEMLGQVGGCRASTVNVCPTIAGAECLSRSHNLTVDVIPHGIDFDVFNRSAVDDLGGAQADEPYIAVVSANQSRKNLFQALEVAKRLDMPIRLRTSPQANGYDLKAQARYLRLHAEFVPVMSDRALANFYRQAHCLLVTSNKEGFCLPAFEAAACGTSVVAPAYGGRFVGPFAEFGFETYSAPHAVWNYGDQRSPGYAANTEDVAELVRRQPPPPIVSHLDQLQLARRWTQLFESVVQHAVIA